MKKILLIGILMVGLSSCSNKSEESVVVSDTNQSEQGGVSAKDGGVGFEKIASSLGYQTAIGKDYGNPNAVKGGVFHDMLANYPNVLRAYGPNTNTTDVTAVTKLVYAYGSELITYNTETNKWERGLADYWKFSNDNKTLTLRINPNIKFSDGSKLTVDDIIATHEMITSEDLGDPAVTSIHKKYKMTKISDHILQVDTDVLEWSVWMNLNTEILPASYIEKVSPKEYNEKYAFDFMPSLGAYTYDKENSIDQELIVLKRNPNWWGYMYDEFKNINNFDEVHFKIIRENKVAQESLKSGELDRYTSRSTDWWFLDDFMHDKTDLSALKRNLIVKKAVFNALAKRRNFIFVNSNRIPDVRVRKAIAVAFDKDLVIDKILHNDVVKNYSITPLTPYESPNLEKYPYSPEEAGKLLDEAGYNIIDTDGVRKNDKGERLEYDVFLYKEDANERLHTVLQENLANVGIKMNLTKSDFPTLVKKVNEKDFALLRIGISGGAYPEYDVEFLSSLAKEKNNLNGSCFADPEADRLINEYLTEKDPNKRYELGHKIDEVVTRSFNYVNLWVAPYSIKEIYWNKFGISGGYLDDNPAVYWYLDTKLDAQLQKALTDESIVMEEGNPIIDPFGLKPATYDLGQY